jgi:opacity protein-like surface antigen
MRVLNVLPAAALAVCVSTFAPTTAHAQVSLAMGGGPTFPISALNNTYTTGYNVMAGLGVHIPTSPFGIRLDGMFNQLPDKTELFGGKSFHAQIWTANANLVASLLPGGPVVPYLIGGVGFYNSSFHLGTSNNTISTEGSTHDNDVGLNGGGGVRVNFGGIGIFGEARYHYIFTSGTHVQMIPITFGVRFGG